MMQVVAHQDDDLLFMNPDVARDIHAGMAMVTVYVTAGQKSGMGGTESERAMNRQRGAQNAYAEMAGVSDGDSGSQREWDYDTWTIGDRTVERYTLRARPDIKLIFMGLRDGELDDVWKGGTVQSVVPWGSRLVPVSYDHPAVVKVLTAIMNSVHPTVLRAQDTAPVSFDHRDHVAAAKFAGEASAGYHDPHVEVSYRDYGIAGSPPNLPDRSAAEKLRYFTTYRGPDGSGGFRYDSSISHVVSYARRLYYRWPRGTNWAVKLRDGRLAVFVVVNGQVQLTEQDGKGTWAGPVTLPDAGGPLAAGLAVAVDEHGKAQVFAHRLSDHHLVTTEPGRAGWTDLGSPSSKHRSRIGSPAVTAGKGGLLHLFVKNGSGGISTLWQGGKGGWRAKWRNLGGSDVQDGLSAVHPHGKIEVYGSTRDHLIRWRQDRPDGAFRRKDLGGRPASPPTAIIDHDGDVQVAYRGQEGALMLRGPEGRTVDLGGTGTGAPAAALPHKGGPAFLGRDLLGGIIESPARDLGGVIVETPAAVTDDKGEVQVFALGVDGRLYQYQPGDWHALS
jgi:LmbE family N-acetylglucosaminyl deacetylase